MKNIRIKYLPVLFVFITLIPSRSYANHIEGADITWKHYSADTFLFTAAVYRSCTGIKVTNSPFTYFGTSPGYTAPKTIYGTMCCTKDVTPGTYGCDQCNTPGCPYPYGTELVTIDVKIAFPSGCCDWYVSWQQNYRDGAISSGPSGEVFYVEAEINTCLSQPDNSPSFNVPANNIFCVNQCNIMDNSAKDMDRNYANEPDSLVYKLVSPLQAHGKDVSYKKGFSYTYPFDVAKDSVPCIGFAMDHQTGMLKFEPKQLETSVVAIEVDEWRKDTSGTYDKIGSIRRDIETFVEDCNINNSGAPIIPGIYGGTTYSEIICAGQQSCFRVQEYDLIPQDTDYLSWHQNDSMPGATFTIGPYGYKWQSASFCWSPDSSMIRSKPYTFTATAIDNSIPPLSTSKTFSIYVVSPPKAMYTAVNKCGVVTFSAKPAPDSGPINSYEWEWEWSTGYVTMDSIAQNITWQYLKNGLYYYTLKITSPNGCTISYDDSIYVHTSLETSLPQDTIVCAASPGIKLIPAVMYGTAPFNYLWNTGETSQTKSAVITKDTFFTVSITDANGCAGNNTAFIHFQKPLKPHNATIVYKCLNSGIQLNSTDISSKLVWTAVFPNKTIPDFADSNPVYVNDTGIYIARAANSSVCPGTDSFIVKNLRDSIIINNIYECYGTSLQLSYNGHFWIDSGTGWMPDSNNFISINCTNPAGYKIKRPGIYLTHDLYCQDTIYDDFIIYARPKYLIKNLPELCIYQHALNLNNYENPLNKGGTWNYPLNRTAISDSLLFPSILGVTAADSNLGNVYYRYPDSFGCKNQESSRIIIWSKVFAGPDANIWKGCGKYILNNDSVTPRFGGIWTLLTGTPPSCIGYNGDTVIFDPDSVPGNGRYGFVYTYNNKSDSSACFGSDTVYIRLITKPVISINPIDSLCDDTNPFHITVSPPGGHFIFSDSTNPSALQGSDLYPIVAGLGYHRLRYVVGNVSTSQSCIDTAGIGFYVIQPPDADFKTEDAAFYYCASHRPVKLIPKIPGGFFVGATYTKNDTAYFDPSLLNIKGNPDFDSVSYILPYHNGQCSVVSTQYFRIQPTESVKIISPTSLCGNDGVYTILAVQKNCNKYLWLAYDSVGQDEGYFANQSEVDTILSADFIPGPAEVKQGFFTVHIVGSGNGCADVRDSQRFFIKPAPIPDFLTLNRVGCDPLKADFKNLSYDTSSAIIKYEWNFGDTSAVSNVSNPVHLYHTIAGDSISFYDVSLKAYSVDGCSKTIDKPYWIIVYTDPVPIIQAVPAFTTLDHPSIRFGLSPQSRWIDATDTTNQYLWHFIPQGNDTGGYSTLANPVHIYTDTGKYTVNLKVTINNSCYGTDNAYAIVDIRPTFAIFIPNIFVPGSGIIKNMNFKPVISSYSKYSMTIFSRWGNGIYETNDANAGWDGTIQGQDAPTGVYVYKIEVTDLYGKTYKYTGNVTLWR